MLSMVVSTPELGKTSRNLIFESSSKVLLIYRASTIDMGELLSLIFHTYTSKRLQLPWKRK